MRAYQASAMLWRHTWEEYETLGQVLGSPREWGPEGLENRGSVWSPGGRCWLWVVWEVISLKNTRCHLVVWNKLPCNYLGCEVHLQCGGIADLCFLLIVHVWRPCKRSYILYFSERSEVIQNISDVSVNVILVHVVYNAQFLHLSHALCNMFLFKFIHITVGWTIN